MTTISNALIWHDGTWVPAAGYAPTAGSTNYVDEVDADAPDYFFLCADTGSTMVDAQGTLNGAWVGSNLGNPSVPVNGLTTGRSLDGTTSHHGYVGGGGSTFFHTPMFTIELWARFDVPPGALSAKGNLNNQWLEGSFDTVAAKEGTLNYLQGNYYSGNGAGARRATKCYMPSPISADWHHYAFVLGEGNSVIYFDGQMVAQNATNGNMNTGNDNEPIYLGTSANAPATALEIAGVAIYNGRKIDAQRIASHAAAYTG